MDDEPDILIGWDDTDSMTFEFSDEFKRGPAGWLAGYIEPFIKRKGVNGDGHV